MFNVKSLCSNGIHDVQSVCTSFNTPVLKLIPRLLKSVLKCSEYILDLCLMILLVIAVSSFDIPPNIFRNIIDKYYLTINEIIKNAD